MISPSRNQACPCGSGKKYKHCCAQGSTARPAPVQQGLIQLETGQLLPIPQAMNHAVQLHQAGRIRKAEAIYRQIVQKQPNHADAQHLLGLVYHQTGQHDLAYTHIAQAISLNAQAALFHNNLGEVCRALHRLEEAQACYARALDLQPTLLEAHRNIGLTLLAQNKPDQAETYLRQLIARHPTYLGGYWALLTVLKDQKKTDEILMVCDAGLEQHPLDLSLLHAKGHTLRTMGQLEQSAEHYRQAIKQQPQLPELYRYLAVVLMQLGDTEATIECLQNEIRLSPDASAQHLLASLQNITTDRAPASYVSELFNSYADNFDQHLVGKLEYRTHALVAQTIRDTLGDDAPGLDILDLGCGTGLFGEEIKDIKKSLVGIDLASRMIDRTRERGIYDELIVGDLLEYLDDVQAGRFDLIVATDVFIYVGDLLPVFKEASRILQPGRWFAFSLEAAPEVNDWEFILASSGRYQHSQAYIERLCAEFNFEISRFSEAPIRKENNQPIAGYIYLLKKIG